MAARCLIVANQTLGGPALDDAIRSQWEGGCRSFLILVPSTRVDHEVSNWFGGFGGFDAVSPDLMRASIEDSVRRQEAAEAEGRRRAEHRLALMLEKVDAMGGEAVGEIGSADPVEAITSVLDREPAFAHIIVSTLPAGVSRWVKMDLPNRIRRVTDTPVTAIEAGADDAFEEPTA